MSPDERERTLRALLTQTRDVARHAEIDDKAEVYRLRARREQLRRLLQACPGDAGDSPDLKEALAMMLRHEATAIEAMHRRLMRQHAPAPLRSAA